MPLCCPFVLGTEKRLGLLIVPFRMKLYLPIKHLDASTAISRKIASETSETAEDPYMFLEHSVVIFPPLATVDLILRRGSLRQYLFISWDPSLDIRSLFEVVHGLRLSRAKVLHTGCLLFLFRKPLSIWGQMARHKVAYRRMGSSYWQH